MPPMQHPEAPAPSTTAELLESLRSAAAEMRAVGRADSAAGGSAATAASPTPSLAATTHTNLLLQLSALHKGFLALSDALMEEVESAAMQRQVFNERLEGLRCELGARLDIASQLHEDLQGLAELDADLRQDNSLLTERVKQLEAQVARFACL